MSFLMIESFPSGGVIAGIVIGALLAIVGVGLLWWFFGRRKTRGRDQFVIDSHHGHDGFDPKDNPLSNHIIPFDASAAAPLRSRLESSTRRSFDGNETISLPPTSSNNPPSTNLNDPFGVYAQYSAASGAESAHGAYTSGTFESINHPRDSSYSATTSSTVVRQWSGSGGYPGPQQSSQPFPHTRHEQDAGPLLPLVESDEDDEGDPEVREAERRAAAGGTLPPMYTQLTGSSGSLQVQQQRAREAEQKRAPRGQLRLVDA